MTQAAVPPRIQVHLDYDRCVNYALQQNDVPIVKAAKVTNLGTEPLADLEVWFQAGPGLSNLTKPATAGKNEQQVAASGGARGVGADRLAKGGDNPNPVKPAISPADVAAFRKGIV